MSAGKQRLSDEHRRELEGQSVIDTAIVAERGYETITADQSAYLSALGIQVRSRDRPKTPPEIAASVDYRRGSVQISLFKGESESARGIPERVAMQLAGHKTRSVFERYNIVSNGDLRAAAAKLQGLTGTKKEQSEAFSASNESERSRIAK